MISDEAVEAAARVFIATRSADNFVSPQEYAVAMLEAAAPHLQSVAWERGVHDGYHHRPNPYKKRDTP